MKLNHHKSVRTAQLELDRSVDSLKPLDIAFMRAIHQKVNVVPVIAKADTLTKTELAQLKQTVIITTISCYDCLLMAFTWDFITMFIVLNHWCSLVVYICHFCSYSLLLLETCSLNARLHVTSDASDMI